MAVSGNDVVTEAKKFLGDPYVYGATGPSSFDCSGLVYYVAKQLGFSVPRTSEEQYQSGTPVSAAQLEPGDLVFAAGSDGSASAPGHVGIYAGGQEVIEAPHTGENVRVTPLSQFDAIGYRRMTGTTAGTGGGGASSSGFTIPGLGSLGGILSIPSEITGFFSKATDDLTKTASFFSAFTRPSTYIRLGAGWFGLVFFIASMFFLVREAKDS
jgi:hypothetical protein